MTDEPMTNEQGAEAPLLQRELMRKPLNPRRAVSLIASVSLLLTVGGGLAVWLIDRDEFGDLGSSLWWSLQTVTTVGYGDIVPKDGIGRLIGAVLMLNGIALVSVITAAVTATLVEQARRRRAGDQGLPETLGRIEGRLSEIEAQLDRLAGEPRSDR